MTHAPPHIRVIDPDNIPPDVKLVDDGRSLRVYLSIKRPWWAFWRERETWLLQRITYFDREYAKGRLPNDPR